jgi:esterase/lipase superfamily enzyme
VRRRRRSSGPGPIGSALLAALLAAGCGSATVPLMPTPILFTEVGLDPLADVPPAEQWTPRRVYYATVRERDADLQKIDYTNRPSDQLSFGLVLIGFGGPDLSWADLSDASIQAERTQTVDLSIAGVVEAGRADRDASAAEAAEANRGGWLLEDMNDAIADARDKDVLVYVHGAKVNFYNACAYAAQLDHFMGRDMTSLAFSWPARQNLLAYGLGGDVERAHQSAPALATLLEILAEATEARRIHLLSWSAGARVATAAFLALSERHPGVEPAALRERLRIGTVYFAAGDIPRDRFVEALPTIHALSDRVIVTVSSRDEALLMSKRFMGGDQRLGQKGGNLDEQQRATLGSLGRLEVVDVSAGSEERGFDITGHRYWFSHSWASSDVLLAVRSDLGPAERGLSQGEAPILWTMPADYPQRLRRSLRDATFRR